MLHDELREEVPHLRRLRLVAGRVVLNRFRASDIVDSYDQRLDLGVLRGRVEVEAEQSQCDQGDEDKRDLEVRVHDQCGAVELHELALRAIQSLRVQVGNGGVHDASSTAESGAQQLPCDVQGAS